MSRRFLSLLSLLLLFVILASTVQAGAQPGPQLGDPAEQLSGPPTPADLGLLEPGAQPLRRPYQHLLVEPDPWVQGMMDQVISSTLYQYVGDLSGEWPTMIGGQPYTITSRQTTSGEHVQKANQYVYEHFQSLGIDAYYHDWSLSGFTGTNVVGEIPGLVHPERIVILSAHLDDTSDQNPNETAPGADDNGSGTAGVMVAADILSQYQWACTLRFVTFTGEEQGLLGSKMYAHDIRLNGDQVTDINMDMVGYNTLNSPPGIELMAKATATPTLELTYLYSDVVGAYNLNLIPEIYDMGIGGSDHASFWIHDYPAMLAIEDSSDDFSPYYHTIADRLSTLDMNYFTDFVRASIGTLVHYSDCLITGGVGLADGHVTATAGGAPIEGATITFVDGLGQEMPAMTDASGYYVRTLPIGVYTATATAYGYLPATAVVPILSGTLTTQDFSLEVAPDYVLSGAIVDAGSGAPLYGRITVPGTPLAPLWSDPVTGFYSVTIAAGAYTLHVTSTAHLPADIAVVVEGDLTQDLPLQPYACVLLVDDDENSPDVEDRYMAALDTLGVGYDYWNTDDGEPTLAQLAGHNMVLWFTAKPNYQTFEPVNEAVVSAYLDNGGRFFFTSQDYLGEFGVTPFAANYLGVNGYYAASRTDPVGTTGNPIGDGLGPYFLVPIPGWSSTSMRADSVTSVQASPFHWNSLAQDNSSNYQGNGFRTVFLAWPPELIPDPTDRAVLIGRVIDWLDVCEADGALEGTVTDAMSGAPLEAVTVTVEPGPIVTTTDATGHYDLPMSDGVYQVTAEHDGYFSQTATVTVTSGLTATLDFALEPFVPAITVTPLAVEATLVEGDLLTTTLTITNDGDADLLFSLAEVPDVAWLFESPITATLAPGANISVELLLTAPLPGLYTTTLEVSSNDPLQPVVPVAVMLTSLPACDPVTATVLSWTPITPTAGQVVTLTVSATGTLPISFTWDLGDGTTGSGALLTHTYAVSGTYTVVATAANDCGSATASGSFWVEPVVVPPAVYTVYLPVVFKN